VEGAHNNPARRLAVCRASPLQEIRSALWPYVKPVLLSYGFRRLEI
ncbi:phosphonate ABC transporter, permease protein PhnE, partial [Klebsiella pneumoniae]